MYYRILGNTGLQVSVLSYGFWATFGVKEGLLQQEGVQKAKDMLKIVRNAGVNFFDNAEAYGEPYGSAEIIMGEAIAQLRKEEPEQWRRSSIIISTKIFWGGDDVNEKGLSKKHIHEGLNKSLERLQCDYVDLVFCHRPDEHTSTEVIVRAMTDVIRSGKALVWGTSEWSAQQITEAFFIAEKMGLEPPQMEQPQYNLFHRERFEHEYFPVYRKPYNIGTTIWSPLASGFLTGKYNDGIPEGSRASLKNYGWLAAKIQKMKDEGKLEILKKLQTYAETELDTSLSRLAIAWCVKNKNVTTVILGATKVEQIEDNLKALEVVEKLTSEHMDDIDQILGNKPTDFFPKVRPFSTI